VAIEARNVTKRFGDFVALDDVSVDVASGSLTALLGPSGSGKSTLLRVIAGLEMPERGVVFISGREATALAPQKRGVGFVFQHYAPFTHMTVRENVAFGLRVRRAPRSVRAWTSCSSSSSSPASASATPRSSRAAAPADGARPRARTRAGGPPPRRAVRCARCARPGRAPLVVAEAARRDARDDDLRHPRPGGGARARRLDRRDEPAVASSRPRRPACSTTSPRTSS